jgi:hypothetical protein
MLLLQFVIIAILIQLLTEESEPHSAKHLSLKISNDAGRMISTKPVPLNASDSIRDTHNPY